MLDLLLIFAIRPGLGSISVEFAVQFRDEAVRRSCAYFDEVRSSCIHSLLVLKHSRKVINIVTYFHDSWKSWTFVTAYFKRSEDNIMPIALKNVLERDVCNAPSILREKRRPTNRRIPSQQATAKLKSAKRADVE